MAISAIQIIEQQANAYLDNFANSLDSLQKLYEATGDPQVQECINRMLARYQSKPFSGAPASRNNGKSDGNVGMRGAPESDPKYFAPTKRLQDCLCEPWFDMASADKKKYTVSWRNQLIEDLMESDCRNEVAEAWSNSGLRLQVKGRVIGALTVAGVFLKKKYTPIARIYYGTREDTKETDTLAKYMGEYKKTFYGDWIVDYVTNPPIEKGRN